MSTELAEVGLVQSPSDVVKRLALEGQRIQEQAQKERAEKERKKIEPVQPDILQTDLGNGIRLAQRYMGVIHYCPSLGWLFWDGCRWKRDDIEINMMIYAKETAAAMYREAWESTDKKEAKTLAKHALKSQQRERLRAMIDLARSEHGITIPADRLDQEPLLFNCANGTLDLVTGELLNFDSIDLLTQQSPVVFDRNAQCPKWIEFLNFIFSGNQNIISFLQKALGYTLTAKISEQCFFVLYGGGKNGKTTLLNVVMEIIGPDMACQTPTETLLIKKFGGIPNDLARLRGMRFVGAIEANEGQRLAESLIKQMTGGDRVVARFLRHEFFEYTPNYKIWLGTNHKPVIRGEDDAIWRRIRLLPFNVQIPPEKRVQDYHEVLLLEASGILNWLLEGCMRWRAEGLGTAKEIDDAVGDYRKEMDATGRFIDEVCHTDALVIERASALYQAYKVWAERNSEFVLSNVRFAGKMTERGFEKKREGKGMIYKGIEIDQEALHELMPQKGNKECMDV